MVSGVKILNQADVGSLENKQTFVHNTRMAESEAILTAIM